MIYEKRHTVLDLYGWPTIDKIRAGEYATRPDYEWKFRQCECQKCQGVWAMFKIVEEEKRTGIQVTPETLDDFLKTLGIETI